MHLLIIFSQAGAEDGTDGLLSTFTKISGGFSPVKWFSSYPNLIASKENIH